MANPSESSYDSADINEKLYTDSYYLYLKNRQNDLPEASNALRDLIRQVNIHSEHLHISESSAKQLSDEFHVEYYDVVDSINSPLLLPVCDIETLKIDTSHEPDSSVTIRKALDELNSYLNCLKINLSPVTPSGSLFESKVISNVKITQNVPTSNQRANLSSPTLPELPSKSYVKNMTVSNLNAPKLHTNVNLSRKSSEFLHKTNIKHNSKNYHQIFSKTSSVQSIPHFQSNTVGTGLANKRIAEENGNSNSGPSSKRHNIYRNPKLPSQAKSVPSKVCGSGFIPASSMYRNPLKKSDDEKLTESTSTEASQNSEMNNHESLKHFDKKIVDVIFNEIMDFSPNIKWSDIAGLDFVKTTIQEIVIWPLLRPDIFTGLRAPPRGILLFGPPGTGKTLIGKCIATESNSTFFCISASSLASKWVGESEQLVRALFTVARLNQPAVIFVDEIDSLLSQRSDKDQDFSRKLKTEFLVQFDGAKTSSEERVLVVGATNRPHELDEAARRRFVKRLYVPLPEASARRQIVHKLLTAHQHDLSECDFTKICDKTKGYSGSDVAHLCKEAAMGPIRSIGPENIKTVSLDQVRPINVSDFLDALRQVRASVAQDDLNYYLEWNKKFGSFGV